MSGNDSEDVTACEKKLGKEPPAPEEGRSIAISENLAERLQTGIVKDNRIGNYDNYWIDKIACIDESHSVRNNLDLAEAEQTLKRLTEYAQSAKPKITFEEQRALGQCFEKSQGERLQCSEKVEEFIQQVDRLLYEAVRKDSEEPRPDKKITYAEKFKRGYSF